MKNAWTLLMLSQGIPAILAGDENCNTQNGNNNVYCQDNETGWNYWNLPKCYEELYIFVRKLIQFRKLHPVFHMDTEPAMSDTLGNGYPDLSYHSDKVWYMDEYRFQYSIGMLYCGDYAVNSQGEKDDYFYVAVNMGWTKQKFAMPDLPKTRKWYKQIDTNAEESFMEQTLEVTDRVVEVPPRTIVVYVGQKVQVKTKDEKRTKRKVSRDIQRGVV